MYSSEHYTPYHYAPSLFVDFYNNYIFSYNFFLNFFFLQNTLVKPSIPLECKYDKLQFCIRISSSEASKQKLYISTLYHVYNKTYRRKILKCLLSQMKGFRVCKHWSLCSLSRRASTNSCNVLEAPLLDRVGNESIIVDFLLVWPSNLKQTYCYFIMLEQSIGRNVQVRIWHLARRTNFICFSEFFVRDISIFVNYITAFNRQRLALLTGTNFCGFKLGGFGGHSM